jgi:mannose-6-phosphate isomerase-like protein (cupin superfamily)
MTTNVLTAPTVLKFGGLRPSWAYPEADKPGRIRGGYPHLNLNAARGHMVIVPPGQGGLPISSNADHIALILEGSAEFAFEGLPPEVYQLEQYDLLGFPAGSVYQYTNTGDRTLLWFSFSSSVGQWPCETTYSEERLPHTT